MYPQCSQSTDEVFLDYLNTSMLYTPDIATVTFCFSMSAFLTVASSTPLRRFSSRGSTMFYEQTLKEL